MIRKHVITAFGVTSPPFFGISFWPSSSFFWQPKRQRWIACREFFIAPKYLRVDIPGATLLTLERRARYRGGRKARRAERRLRDWKRGAYFSDSFLGLVAGSAAVLFGMSVYLSRKAA